jgi:hypothetical protein
MSMAILNYIIYFTEHCFQVVECPYFEYSVSKELNPEVTYPVYVLSFYRLNAGILH